MFLEQWWLFVVLTVIVRGRFDDIAQGSLIGQILPSLPRVLTGLERGFTDLDLRDSLVPKGIV